MERRKVYYFVLIVVLILNLSFVPKINTAKNTEETRFNPLELIISLKQDLILRVDPQTLSINNLGDDSLNQLAIKYEVQSVQQVFTDSSTLDSIALKFGLPGTLLLTVAPDTDLWSMREAFQNNKFIEFAEFNRTVNGSYIPDDSFFRKQWALNNWLDNDIDAPEAWNIQKGKANIIIAVVDTGVLYTHPDLAGTRILTDIDYDFVNDDDDSIDDNGHGTHVAGIIGANTNNNQGIAGICFRCSILPIKVLNADNKGSADGVANGIRYAADKGARIISMSLGMDPNCGCSKTIAQALNYAFEKGSLLIAASGNDSKGKISYPAASSRVMAIGSSTKLDRRSNFSNYGIGLDLVAPGSGIKSTYLDDSYKNLSGTSMATPHASGVAGLVWSQNPGLKNVKIWWVLQHSTDDLGKRGWDKATGWGRLNAKKAVQMENFEEVYAPIDKCDSEPEEGCGDCSTTVALSDSESASQNMKVFRQFRDTVLSKSERGQTWTQIFYRHTLEISGLLAANPVLKQQAGELLTEFMPAIHLIINDGSDGNVILTSKQIQDASAFKDALIEYGSPALADDLRREWMLISPERYSGQNVITIWQTISLP